MNIRITESQFKRLVKRSIRESKGFSIPFDESVADKAYSLGRKFYLNDFDKGRESFYFNIGGRNFSVSLNEYGHIDSISDIGGMGFADDEFIEKFDDMFQRGFDDELDNNA